MVSRSSKGRSRTSASQETPLEATKPTTAQTQAEAEPREVTPQEATVAQATV